MKSPVIYIIDDMLEQLEMLSIMLESSHYQVKTYTSGKDFFEEGDFGEIACLLLDNHMPVMSGLEIQIELIRRKVDLPIIFMSGESGYATVVDAVRKGALNFLQKPFSRTELLEQVDDAITESRRRHKAQHLRQECTCLLESLTPRERQVYNLLIAGNINKLVSEELDISLSTVAFHRANLVKKLGVSTLTDLIAISDHCKS